MSANFYRDFEQAHRGGRNNIATRLSVYQPLVNWLALQGSNTPAALDLGCGRGEWLELLQHGGWAVTGVDTDAAMLEEAKLAGVADVHVNDALIYLGQCQAETFDLVSLFHVAEHVPHPYLVELLQEAKRVLKPRGMLLLETPNPENLAVGAHHFYLDPTHARPIPMGLALFCAQHCGMAESHILRMNASVYNVNAVKPTLFDVLEHSSPDYAMLSFKSSLESFNNKNGLFEILGRLNGPNLRDLCLAYDKNNSHEMQALRAELKDLKEQVAQFAQNSLLQRLFQRGKKKAPSNTVKTRRLFLDVSLSLAKEHVTGIERVSIGYLRSLAEHAHEFDFQLVPVALEQDGYGQWHYMNANSKELISFVPTDLLWCLDYYPVAAAQAAAQHLFQRLKQQGVKFTFLLHDLLPIEMPGAFPTQAYETHKNWLHVLVAYADLVVCVSSDVKQKLQAYCAQNGLPCPRAERIYSGYDFAKPAAATTPPQGQLEKILGAGVPFVLSVGTVEPRKGFQFAIKAFNALWHQGVKVNWVLVGKEGWAQLAASPEHAHECAPVREIVTELRNHPQLGERLFWLSNCSDETLATLYQRAAALLNPSLGEGYGLPLAEAMARNTPLIVSNIAVFKEVAGENAVYFEPGNSTAIAAAISQAAENQFTFPELKNSQVQPGFNDWSESAKTALKFLKSIV